MWGVLLMLGYTIGMSAVGGASGMVGCVSSYTEVRRKDTMDGYREFIRQYPQSPDRKPAEERLETLAFQKASEENSEESYSAYLREFPQGRYRRQASTQIEIKAYQRARDRDTLENYRAFLERFPRGQFSREAKERIEEKFFQKALQFESIRGLEAYLRHFPKGRFVQQAVEKHHNLWWQRVQKNPSIRNYRLFVERFPNGPYAQDARQKILVMRYERYELSGKWWLLQGWLKANPESPMQDRARKHMKLFRDIYPSLERARRLAESGEPSRAAMVYRLLYQRYAKRFPIVARIVQSDLQKHNIPLDRIQ
ncbi:hypothetical protein L6R29_16030 [Myxococcota bacterium]|nr:hypothetical protein [Myxococcota bacterium]